MGQLQQSDTQNQWLDTGQVAKPVEKQNGFLRKALLCVWWNFECVIYFELFPNDRTINVEVCCSQLDRMYAKLDRKYIAIINRKSVHLQQDNAKSHPARQTKEKVKELDRTSFASSVYSGPRSIRLSSFLFNGTLLAQT